MMRLRTEWTVLVKKANGEVYSKDVRFNREAEEEVAIRCKNFYETNPRFNGFTVEFWKVRYLGSSLHDKERIW